MRSKDHLASLLSLLLSVALARPPCTQLSLTGRAGLTTFKRTPVSASEWKTSKQQPSREKNPVDCGRRCLQMREVDPQSCNSLTFSDTTGECHLGNVSQTAKEPTEFVLMVREDDPPGSG